MTALKYDVWLMFQIAFFVLSADYVGIGVIVKLFKWKLSNAIENRREAVN